MNSQREDDENSLGKGSFSMKLRKSIASNAAVQTRVIDSHQLSAEGPVLTVPGESYPETGLRLVTAGGPLVSRELCCGTHVPSTGFIEDFCITLVKGASSQMPTIHAITGEAAKEARELFCRAEKLAQVIDICDPERKKEEITNIRGKLSKLCGGSGAPSGEYAKCVALLEKMQKKTAASDVALQAVAEEEVREASTEAIRLGRRFVVHFLRCSYLMHSDGNFLPGLRRALEVCPAGPALLLGCAGGVIVAESRVPRELVTSSFDASSWLSCVLPVFGTRLVPQADPTSARMCATKVSLITCEQKVQDAMLAAIKYAQAHCRAPPLSDCGEGHPTMNRRHN